MTDDIGLGVPKQSLVVNKMISNATSRSHGQLGTLPIVAASDIGSWKKLLDTSFNRGSEPSYVIAHRDWTCPHGSKVYLTLEQLRGVDIVICTINAIQGERNAGMRFRLTPGERTPGLHFLGEQSKWKVLIMDKVESVRNPSTASHICVRMIDAEYRIGLTGTALRNRVGDWHSLFKVIRFCPWDNLKLFRASFAKITVPSYSKDLSARPTPLNVSDWDAAVNQVAFGRPRSILNLPSLHDLPVEVTINPYERRRVMEEWVQRKNGPGMFLKQIQRLVKVDSAEMHH